MADWATISALATAGGTLVLAVATFASVRAGQQAARISERSFLIGMRPVLFPSRREDPVEKAHFGDGTLLKVPGGTAAVKRGDGGELYFALALRNAGSGLAVIHGWKVVGGRAGIATPDVDGFRIQGLDLYIAAGDSGFWEGALRIPEERDADGRADIGAAISRGDGLTIDLLYGDFEGGQRTISRFWCTPRENAPEWSCGVIRHWPLDGDAPRPNHDAPGAPGMPGAPGVTN
jgi:hypothetical protein